MASISQHISTRMNYLMASISQLHGAWILTNTVLNYCSMVYVLDNYTLLNHMIQGSERPTHTLHGTRISNGEEIKRAFLNHMKSVLGQREESLVSPRSRYTGLLRNCTNYKLNSVRRKFTERFRNWPKIRLRGWTVSQMSSWNNIGNSWREM